VGKRISELTLDNGTSVQAAKSYKVAGWASVNEQKGAPIWDVVAKHLKSGRPPNRSAPGVTLKGVEGNPGISKQV
jgi:sulfur-oxidizing protein SoxB